ncbi:hypothetical protein [Streptomyces clavuligerus]|uniref:Secreted protein n=1 Tax=Streptomyces clavuligerus TaxID=1901 RepID=B5GLN7_STRCL|nr:hypothetical protein [Streptomyces clavuligerus]EDY47233.1 hypothetical protein SSCG_00261 [Streptomyces clavuligerus]EFG04899.1 Hypothetical protein SCLAV_p1417 [Streptomyces clavuligerus]MBY6306662.1 hypothetical protein [Streptomyces clavuligerus]QCS10732.1 hypothetical protein CRV15_35005 [Streptomyces clavuligerus]QPJ97233.1 hypothetical protein GE265_29475 [Streptomyces clavuligerus]
MRIRAFRASAVGAIALFAVIGGTQPSVAGTAPSPVTPSIVHQVPSVPLTIDGRSVDPRSITQYNGRPLYMAALPDEGPRGRLVTFTEAKDFERFVRANNGPARPLAEPRALKPGQAVPTVRGPGGGSTPNAAPPGYNAFVFDNIDYGDGALSVSTGYGWPDLTEVSLCYFWPFCTDWNDRPSSAVADTPGGQMLWEHIHWGGSRLWIPSRTLVRSLGDYGWNDRTSSFAAY